MVCCVKIVLPEVKNGSSLLVDPFIVTMLIVSYLRHEVETTDHITEIYRQYLIVSILACLTNNLNNYFHQWRLKTNQMESAIKIKVIIMVICHAKSF